jgi:RNA polymerase sigma-70 factor (ECF subfamily)
MTGMTEGGAVQGVAATVGALVEPVLLERVFVEHRRRVFRAAYRITGSAQDAEDVLQTVFLRLARLGEAAPLGNPGSYLYRAAVNSALDLLRARRDRPTIPLDDALAAPGGAPGPDRHSEAAEIRGWLREAMAALPPRAAEMFALRYLEGEPNREIARILGVSRITVAVTLHRTRLRLRGELRTWRRGGR